MCVCVCVCGCIVYGRSRRFLHRPIARGPRVAENSENKPATLNWFEMVFMALQFGERCVLFPAIVVLSMAADGPALEAKWGPEVGAVVLTLAAMVVMRLMFSNPGESRKGVLGCARVRGVSLVCEIPSRKLVASKQRGDR